MAVKKLVHLPEKIRSNLFTKREMVVLGKLNEGKSNKQISEELCISVNTVKTHLKNIFVKLGVSSRSQAITQQKSTPE